MNARLAWVPVCVGMLTGCSSDEPPPKPAEATESRAAMMAAPGGQITLLGHGVMTHTDTVADHPYTYKFMWGPHPTTGAAFAGYLDTTTKTVRCTSGYVYISGNLKPQSLSLSLPPMTPEGIFINYWPVVCTNHVSAAAEGTILLVEVDGNNERVYRLDPPSTKKMRVWTDSAAVMIEDSEAIANPPATPPFDQVVRYPIESSPWSPQLLSAAEIAVRQAVIDEAAANGVDIP